MFVKVYTITDTIDHKILIELLHAFVSLQFCIYNTIINRLVTGILSDNSMPFPLPWIKLCILVAGFRPSDD